MSSVAFGVTVFFFFPAPRAFLTPALNFLSDEPNCLPLLVVDPLSWLPDLLVFPPFPLASVVVAPLLPPVALLVLRAARTLVLLAVPKLLMLTPKPSCVTVDRVWLMEAAIAPGPRAVTMVAASRLTAIRGKKALVVNCRA